MRRGLIVLCAFALVLSAGAVGHAAELSLSSPRAPSQAVITKCAQAQIEVSGTAGQAELTVSGIPAQCGGLPLDVWLHDGTTTHQLAADAPAGGGQLTLTPSIELSTHTAALTTIDTWPMPTTATPSRSNAVGRSARTYASAARIDRSALDAFAWRGSWMRASTSSSGRLHAAATANATVGRAASAIAEPIAGPAARPIVIGT